MVLKDIASPSGISISLSGGMRDIVSSLLLRAFLTAREYFYAISILIEMASGRKRVACVHLSLCVCREAREKGSTKHYGLIFIDQYSILYM